MDTILRGGMVVDPVGGGVRDADVLFGDGRVKAVGPNLAATGCTEFSVRGLLVGPGFVDLHSHAHTIAGHRLRALDGVTTALDLEAGLMPIEGALQRTAREGRPLNYGFSASWAAARAFVLAQVEPDAELTTLMGVLADRRWQASSSRRQRSRWLGLLEAELSRGALGIGVLLGYAPSTDPDEFRAVAALAARAGAPVYTHVRELVEVDPATPIDGPGEIVSTAAATGAAMHHCHVNATSGRHVDRVLRDLARGRDAGSRITVESYPYGAGSTAVGAYFLDPARLAARGLRPDSVMLLETGERIPDEGRLEEVRRLDPAAACVVDFLDEGDPDDLVLLRRALAFPDSVVASDAMPVELPAGVDPCAWPLPPGARTHPRTSGTFAKAARIMVRETGLWDWPELFRRSSHLPAMVLADVAPSMRRKGRLDVGFDADIVVVDPRRFTDAATFQEPTRQSVGLVHSFVGGEQVVADGSLIPTSFPGRAVLGEPT